jgi:hypothetical protein
MADTEDSALNFCPFENTSMTWNPDRFHAMVNMNLEIESYVIPFLALFLSGQTRQTHDLWLSQTTGRPA